MCGVCVRCVWVCGCVWWVCERGDPGRAELIREFAQGRDGLMSACVLGVEDLFE